MVFCWLMSSFSSFCRWLSRFFSVHLFLEICPVVFLYLFLMLSSSSLLEMRSSLHCCSWISKF